jgi:hypothetical protein
MTLPIAAFIGRYLRHVPVPGTRAVRAYGLYAPTQGEALTVARAQLGQGPVAALVVLDWPTACSQRGEDHPERCPVCGRRLVYLDIIRPSRSPPPPDVPVDVVA